jgi:hypothetical protein
MVDHVVELRTAGARRSPPGGGQDFVKSRREPSRNHPRRSQAGTRKDNITCRGEAQDRRLHRPPPATTTSPRTRQVPARSSPRAAHRYGHHLTRPRPRHGPCSSKSSHQVPRRAGAAEGRARHPATHPPTRDPPRNASDHHDDVPAASARSVLTSQRVVAWRGIARAQRGTSAARGASSSYPSGRLAPGFVPQAGRWAASARAFGWCADRRRCSVDRG